MDIVLSEQSITQGVVRIPLGRIPQDSYVLKLVRPHDGGFEPVGQAFVFGRGEGSFAQEQSVVTFALRPQGGAALAAGDVLTVMEETTDGQLQAFTPPALDGDFGP